MSDIKDDFLNEIKASFLVETEELILRLETLLLSLERDEDHLKSYDEIKRIAHNIKGSGKAVGFDSLSKFSHSMENLLVSLSTGIVNLSPEIVQLLLNCSDELKSNIEQLKVNYEAQLNHTELISQIENAIQNNLEKNKITETTQLNLETSKSKLEKKINFFEKPKINNVSKSSEDYIKLPLSKIDDLLNSFGEQVIYLSALDHYKDDIVNHVDDVQRTILSLKKLASDLQNSTMSLRMVSLKSLFSKVERAIRDASVALSKKITIHFEGAHLELDKAIVDQLSDPLIHIVRNAVDHGIESNANDRLNCKKQQEGRISVVAKREGGRFVIEIKDDGKGLNKDKIIQKAIEKKIISTATNLNDRQIYDLIFENGFSTKENVSEISGRGVGMNVVKEAVESLKGSCEIESNLGQGTLFRIKLPLSLSLFNGLLVELDGNSYIIPSSQVSEILNYKELELRLLNTSSLIFKLRNQVLELCYLPHFLNRKKTNIDQLQSKDIFKKTVLIVNTEICSVGFVVDSIKSIQRVVQKSLSAEMTICPGASGVTILGDGAPALILDMRQLAEEFSSDFGSNQRLSYG